MDLDDCFAYTTSVRVRVRHRVLGCLFYGVSLSILVGYVGVYELYIRERWGELEALGGTLKVTARPDESLVPVDRLPYCSQAVVHGPSPAVRKPCMSFDRVTTIAEATPQTLLVGTRLVSIVELRNKSCRAHTYGCERWAPHTRDDAFVPDVERHAVIVQHELADSASGREGFDTALPRSAPLVSGDGGALRVVACTGVRDPDPACPSSGDLLHVRDLLFVTGLDLDAPLQATSSLRVRGVSLRLELVYNGSGYSYRARSTKLDANVLRVDTLNESARVISGLHGIGLSLVETGGMRRLEWRTVLLTIISGFALLSAAKTVADLFLLHFAPRRDDYRLFVEQVAYLLPTSEAYSALCPVP